MKVFIVFELTREQDFFGFKYTQDHYLKCFDSKAKAEGYCKHAGKDIWHQKFYIKEDVVN